MSLPTPRMYLGIHTVQAYCNHWRHSRYRTLDLQLLIDRGHGDTPLIELPLRCIDCGRRGHGIIVRSARAVAGSTVDNPRIARSQMIVP